MTMDISTHGTGSKAPEPPKSGKTIKVRDADSIFLHWFNVLVWLGMLATGFGIISGGFVRLMPKAWPEFMQGLFGGNATLASLHVWLGVAWVGVFALYTMIALPRVWRFLRNVLVLLPWTAAMEAWSMIASLGHLFGLNLPAPEAGRFNGAQKLLGTMIVLGSLGIAASGLYLAFAPIILDFPTNPLSGLVFRWALAAHITLVLIVLIGLVAHIYYALVEERWSMQSMKTGEAEIDRIRHHNPKWYRELVEKGEIEP